MSRLLDSLSTTDALADAFSDRSLLGAMLQFEVGRASCRERVSKQV